MGREEGREGGGGGALHGVRRHIHPDRHRLSVCRHPSYSTTQWKPAAAHAARRPNAPLRDAGPKRGMRQDDGMGRVDRADSRLREGGRVGQQEARKTRSGSAAARRWKAQLQNETNCAPASCRRRLPPNRCARTPLAAPRRHAQHKGEASNLHKLRPKYDPEGAGSGGSGVRELRRSSGVHTGDAASSCAMASASPALSRPPEAHWGRRTTGKGRGERGRARSREKWSRISRG